MSWLANSNKRSWTRLVGWSSLQHGADLMVGLSGVGVWAFSGQQQRSPTVSDIAQNTCTDPIPRSWMSTAQLVKMAVKRTRIWRVLEAITSIIP